MLLTLGSQGVGEGLVSMLRPKEWHLPGARIRVVVQVWQSDRSLYQGMKHCTLLAGPVPPTHSGPRIQSPQLPCSASPGPLKLQASVLTITGYSPIASATFISIPYCARHKICWIENNLQHCQPACFRLPCEHPSMWDSNFTAELGSCKDTQSDNTLSRVL